MHVCTVHMSRFMVRISGNRNLHKIMKNNLAVNNLSRCNATAIASRTFSICKSSKKLNSQSVKTICKGGWRHGRMDKSSILQSEITSSELDFFAKRNYQTPISQAVSRKEITNVMNTDRESSSDVKSLPPCISNFVALDCEMVECSYMYDCLARASVVDHQGNVVVDAYVKPNLPITDYRTTWSGITREKLASVTCVNHGTCKQQVLDAIKGKMVVGHSLNCDLHVLNISLPQRQVVDISRISAVRERMIDATGQIRKTYSLKRMAEALLGRSIQIRTHCSVEDATATIDVFKAVFDKWSESNSHILYEMSENDKSYLGDQYWPEHITNSADS